MAFDRQRYERAAHAMQTGVAMTIQRDKTSIEPKHIRTGINAAMADMAAMARLLMAKGIITEDEYSDAVCEGMEAEVRLYESELSKAYGTNITLG